MFIDVHAHVYRRPWPNFDGSQSFPDPEQLVKLHDALGIDRAVLLPLVNAEEYLPQSNDEIIEIAEESGERFIPFCNIDPRAITNTCDAPLDYILKYYRDLGCKGIGEVLPSMDFLDPRMLNLFKHVESVGFPLIFDATGRRGERYGLYDEPGMPQLQACLQRFPKLVFLGHGPAFWAEIAQLELPGDRTGYPDYPVKEEGVVPKLMRKYPNMWGDLSAGSGHNALSRDPDYAVQFLNEFQDRLLFGTDICNPEGPAPMAGFLTGLRDSGRISDTVFRKVARENAVKLLGL